MRNDEWFQFIIAKDDFFLFSFLLFPYSPLCQMERIMSNQLDILKKKHGVFLLCAREKKVGKGSHRKRKVTKEQKEVHPEGTSSSLLVVKLPKVTKVQQLAIEPLITAKTLKCLKEIASTSTLLMREVIKAFGALSIPENIKS